MNVELIGIHKTFGTVHANDQIHLKIKAGTIQGVLGENGAGKSTLMKILSGFIQKDRGRILLDDHEVQINSPADAIRQGIGMLHQDPLDFPPMKVIDDFLIGSPGSIFPNKAESTRAFNALKTQFDFNLDAQAYVDTLTVGERQQLEILRLLWLGARVLILDEPTTGISAEQKIKLFETLRLLAQQGKTVIFVSHKLEDVEQLCHCAAVLRRGQLVYEASAPYNLDTLVTAMFGKTVTLAERQSCGSNTSVLELSHLAVEDNRMKLKNVNLQVCAGEVIGLAGMEGSGQLMLLRACAGLVKPVGGDILLKQQHLTGKNFHAFMQHGVAYLPAARMEEGLVPGLSVQDHFILAREQHGMVINRPQAENLTQNQITEFNIKGASATPIEALSGGNQQRALLALMKSPLSLVLMEHPTRGLDVESTIYIWSKLKARCQNGTAILFISSDLDEILRYSDRILVFFAGKVSPAIPASEVNLEQLGQLIGGKGW